ncbi:VOC family protein [Leptolyngbya sp. AN02str]|uniref:VOC family protein n=1 Tax=Leptolyngbya sp. AN02str TaxID=3423363 RepID=UPI003D31E62A
MQSHTFSPTIFHLAFPVTNLAQTKTFYVDGLGCEPGRENPHSLILNLYGHQLVAHVTHEPLTPQRGVYPRHFGLVFTNEADFDALVVRSHQHQLNFYQPPKERFVGTLLDHRTFFLQDPFYNLLEFKFYRHTSAIFGEIELTQIGDTPLV